MEPKDKQLLPDSIHEKCTYPFSFRVTLFSNEKEEACVWLPVQAKGFYRLSEKHEYQFLYIEEKDGHWYVCCGRPGFFKNVSPVFYSAIPLLDDQYIEVECEDICCSLFVEKLSQEHNTFKNYTIHSEIEIVIGSHHSSDIYYDSKFIAPKHAILTRKESKWHIKQSDPSNIMYVNGRSTRFAQLQLGDTLFIFGLRIIIGTNFLSVNGSDSIVHINNRIIKNISPSRSGYRHYSGQEPVVHQDVFFNRAPRKRPYFENPHITIEAPPVSMERAQMPFLLRMGSSAIMSGKAALSGNYSMLLSSLLFPILSSNYTESQRKEYETKRVNKYGAYLDEKCNEILYSCRAEAQFLNEKYPSINALFRQSDFRKHIWERRPQDDDFLILRVGNGQSESQCIIEYPQRHFELDTDPLEEKMYQLAEKKYMLENVPITFSLIDNHVCGISGQCEQSISFVQQLITQISFFHSYDEVKLVFLLPPEILKELDFVRYLPHTWDDQKNIRFIATNDSETSRISEFFSKQFPEKTEHNVQLNDILNNRPYYVVFAFDKKLLDSMEIIKSTMQSTQNQGISTIAVFDELPKECHSIIRLESNSDITVIPLKETSHSEKHFLSDYCDSDKMKQIMTELANLQIKAVSQKQDLPKTFTFLEMFNAGKVEHLNSLKRWKENNPVRSLSTPVGVATDGSLFTLDLHEKIQGPHGLVAGTTGSGKSEFLITYILSMAVNYHPDEVAFVLIDYKGGGLAGAFENPGKGIRLPHLAGTITNLDGSSIQRSLMAIESELKRRQIIFNEVKRATNEGTVDIYSYQKLYRAGIVSQPMPHLFIISDEFAELKQQQPEFMDKLISAARIGRSLGIHLILATQKPSGVVNDQIRSNTKFRVCLRVQDRTDSMDMLKRPEAAELTDTGRFYLQVGYNEYFALGQSAWCGAEYESKEQVVVTKDLSVCFLDTSGQIIQKIAPETKKNKTGQSQLVSVVRYLSDIANRENIFAQNIWTPPLQKVIDLEELHAAYPQNNHDSIIATIGMIDDPQQQQQVPLKIDLQELRNMMLVGSIGCGKSSLLTSLLFSLSKYYSSEQVNYYILDFSGGSLKAFEKIPHCGAVLTEENETEMERFWKMLWEIRDERKKLFSKSGVSNYDSYCQIAQLPLIIVVIDNYVMLTNFKGGMDLNYKFHEYMRDFASSGIKFIISCNNLNEFPSRCKQEVDYVLTLQMKDRYAYSEALGVRGALLPGDNIGRGICLLDGRPVEYQAAIPFANQTDAERICLIPSHLAQYTQNHVNNVPARHLAIVREDESYLEFCDDISTGRIPLGYSVKDAKKISMPFAQLYTLALYFGNPVGVSPVIENFLYAASRNNMDVLVLKKSKNSLFDSISNILPSNTNNHVFAGSGDGITQLIRRLVQEINQRKIFRNQYCEEHGIPLTSAKLPENVKAASAYIRQNTRPLLVLIEDYADFSRNQPEGSFDYLSTIFKNGKGYNMYFIAATYPESSDQISSDLLLRDFCQDQFMLFFGGRFHGQALTNLPSEHKKITELSNNVGACLMKYAGKFYELKMPCRKPDALILDPDESPII